MLNPRRALDGESCCECSVVTPRARGAIGIQILVPIHVPLQASVIVLALSVEGGRPGRAVDPAPLAEPLRVGPHVVHIATRPARTSGSSSTRTRGIAGLIYLALGTLWLIVSIFSLLIPYMLFRLDPSLDMLLARGLHSRDTRSAHDARANHSFNGAKRASASEGRSSAYRRARTASSLFACIAATLTVAPRHLALSTSMARGRGAQAAPMCREPVARHQQAASMKSSAPLRRVAHAGARHSPGPSRRRPILPLPLGNWRKEKQLPILQRPRVEQRRF